MNMLHNEFIGRKEQLKQLHEMLEGTLKNRCRMALISGEAGMGKSILSQEFARQAQANNETLLVAKGNCNAQVGAVAAYRLFIDLLTQLTGNVESKLAEGSLSEKSAKRLKGAMDISIKALLEYGPDLIGTFVPAGALISKGALYIAKQAGWLSKLDALKKEEISPQTLDKEKLLEQYIELLRSLSARFPLVLILDDLQWADSSSLGLLLHILEKLPKAPIMLLGLVRPVHAWDDGNSSLADWKKTLPEIKQETGNIEIDLSNISEDERRAFVSEYLNACPNKFLPQFHEEIYQKTAGYPLFLSELLKGLEASGKIWRDGDGYWDSQTNINWNMLPGRIEGAIVDRMGQIDDDLHELLAIASVEGINFSVPILAALYEKNEYDVLKLLSRKLEKQYSMVREGAIHEVSGKWLCQYTFSSALFQQYLYNELSRRERMILHGRIARTLEEFYQGQTGTIIHNLALHYNLAGEDAQACRYYYAGGEQALKISAYPEALTLFQAARDRLEKLSDSEADNQIKIDTHIHFCNTLRMVKGWQSEEVSDACTQARDLFRKTKATPAIGPFLFNLWASYLVQMELARASETALENIRLGEELNCDEIRIQGHVSMGNTEYWRGNFETCLEHISKAKALLQGDLIPLMAQRYGQDMRLFILMFEALSVWVMGDEQKAEKIAKEMQEIVESLDQRFGLAVTWQVICWHYFLQEKPDPAADAANSLIALSQSTNLPFYEGIGSLFLGWAQAAKKEGSSLATLEHGFKLVGGDSKSLMYSLYYLFRCQALRSNGQKEQAAEELQAILPVVQSSGSVAYLSEIYRNIGELMAESGESGQASYYYQQAIKIAQQQKAIMFENRAKQRLLELEIT